MIPYHDSNASIPAHVVEARTALLCSPNFSETTSETPRKSNKEAQQPGYTVLIVNDLPDQLELMQSFLRNSGYAVMTAVNARQGLQIAQAERPDLIISTPIVNGIEMCRLIRERPELDRIAILMVSPDRRLTNSLINGTSFRADNYLETPYDPIRLIAKAAQVIECKRTTEALRASEAKYRDLIENLNDVIFAVTKDGAVSYISPVIESVAGYNPSEVIGRSFTEFIFPEDLPSVLRNFDQVMAQKPSPLEYRIETKAGELVWVRTSSRPNIVADQVVGLHGVMTDVTDRKKAEQALRTSDVELRTLFGAMTDVILVLDRNGRYLKIAPTDPCFLYKPSTDLVGKTLHEVFPKVQADFFLLHIRGALLEGRAHKVEYTLQIDGTEVWFEGSVSPLSEDSVIWIARDVTEHKKSEEEREKLEHQFLHSQKMEAVGQLAGGIAHDFNNLLTVINGYSDLSLERLPAGDPLRNKIRNIKKAGERAASLTRQLLAFSRKQILQPKVFDLNSIVSDLGEMLSRLIGENIELRTVLDPELGSVKADPGQIEQVLVNLVVNARDAMPHGGRLTIETRNVYFGTEYTKHHVGVRPGAYVMLAIGDSGSGMDEETKARIFEPFFTTKGPGKGTGLGLSTVYGIVKQSGGNIWPYSEVGEGTTFKVYLPRNMDDAQDHTRRSQPERSLEGTETILLVEDHEIVRTLAREFLQSYGYEVLEAANCDVALPIAERHQKTIDLLLTDVVMPGMSGRSLSDRLATLRPEIKVLFMSGYTDDAIVHHGVLEGGTAFIQKPFAPEDLVRKVRDVLDGRNES
jgi:two-component system, cell cycle sensor histidine kinase and response regulator CckA